MLHLFNVNLKNGKIVSVEDTNIPVKINWVSDFVLGRVLMEDGSWGEGIVDSGVKGLGGGEVIQFERWGFVRFDSVRKIKGKNVYEFWFSHK